MGIWKLSWGYFTFNRWFNSAKEAVFVNKKGKPSAKLTG